MHHKCGYEIANEMQSHGHFKIKRKKKTILEEGKPDVSFEKEGFCICRNQQQYFNMFHMDNIWCALGAHRPSAEP